MGSIANSLIFLSVFCMALHLSYQVGEAGFYRPGQGIQALIAQNGALPSGVGGSILPTMLKPGRGSGISTDAGGFGQINQQGRKKRLAGPPGRADESNGGEGV